MKQQRRHRTISFDEEAWSNLVLLQQELGKSGPSATVAAALAFAVELVHANGRPVEAVLTPAGLRVQPRITTCSCGCDTQKG